MCNAVSGVTNIVTVVIIVLYIGQPKGQGQEKNVMYNRQQKNVHKSKQGNHNRRSGAQYKRNQGMVPS